MARQIPIVLSIAGSDSSGGAGIQADIKTISALGGYAATAITGVTVQSTRKVENIHSIPPDIISGQIRIVMEDLHPQAVKIGMTGNPNTIEAISEELHRYTCPHIVFDPVMVSTSGRKLLSDDAIETICEKLFPITTLVTPNLQEASVLLKTSIHTTAEMEKAVRLLSQTYHCSFLLKGGHLEGNEMCDMLCHNGHIYIYTATRIKSSNLHGTGCMLSSAIATFLARGEKLPEAIRLAKEYVYQTIRAGKDLHIGQGNGPLWHFVTDEETNTGK